MTIYLMIGFFIAILCAIGYRIHPRYYPTKTNTLFLVSRTFFMLMFFYPLIIGALVYMYITRKNSSNGTPF